MRYLVAEEYKEDGNLSFKRGDYQEAVDLYTAAHKSEPRLPIYLLNRAMAELKLNRWDEAEMDCTAVLRKHRTNAKALWRRAKARRSLAQLTGHIEKLIAAEQGGCQTNARVIEADRGCQIFSTSWCSYRRQQKDTSSWHLFEQSCAPASSAPSSSRW